MPPLTPILIPETSNPLTRWGLPIDYDTLTDDGQRRARINAVLQYTHRSLTPQQSARLFVRAVRFFDHYYLSPQYDETGDTIFNPYFYEGPYLPAPDLHDLFHSSVILYKTSAVVGPRGFAKTYSIAKEVLPFLLTNPAFRISYATSVDALAETFGSRIKYQLEYNSRINDDYALMWGKIKPDRSGGSWGMTNFDLSNRSGLFCTSAQSRQRGGRPMIYYLDDPEYDATQSTSMEVLRANAERLIFSLALPMTMRAGARLAWRGTFVSKQHYLWAAIQTRINAAGKEEPIDPRFGLWHRTIVPVILQQPDGTTKSAWPSNFPIDAAERDRLGISHETLTLPEIRAKLGEPVFQAEYLANPGDSGIAYFGELTEDKHGYWFESPDSLLVTDPASSSALLCFHRQGTIIRLPLHALAKEGFRFYATCDTAYTENASSDYKATGIFCISPHGEVFFLDLIANKEHVSSFAPASLVLCSRWAAAALYYEQIRGGSVIGDAFNTSVRDNFIPGRSIYKRVPAIIPYNPGMTDKAARIATALYLRFQHGLIKLPLRASTQYPWTLLFEQIRGFNPYAAACGLANDDVIDIFGMACSPKVLHGIPSLPSLTLPSKTAADLMKEGTLLDPKTGEPLLLTALHSMTREDLLTILDKVQSTPNPQRPTLISL